MFAIPEEIYDMKRTIVALLLTCVLLACSACNPAPGAAQTATPPPPPEGIAPFASGTPQPDPPPEQAAPDLSGAPTLRWLILGPNHGQGDILPTQALSEATHINIELDYVSFSPVGDASMRELLYRRQYDALVNKKPYDLVTLNSFYFSPDRWVADGLFADLTDMLEPYDSLREATADIAMQLSQVGGRNYVLPIHFPNDVNNEKSRLVMRTSATAADGGPIATLDDFLGAMADDPLGRQNGGIVLTETTLNEFRRGYDAFPFSVSQDLLFVFDGQGGVSAYPGSEAFEEDRRLVSRLRGVSLNPIRIMTNHEQAQAENLFDTTFAVGASVSTAWRHIDAKLVQIAPEKPQILHHLPYGRFVHAMPSYATSDIALAFFDAVYGYDEIYEIAKSGKEGVHYTFDADGRYDYVDGWVSLTDYFEVLPHKYWAIDEPIVHELLRTGYELEPMPWNGFVFDPTPVQTAYNTLVDLIMADGAHFDGDFSHITTDGMHLPDYNDPVALNEHVFGNTTDEELSAFLLELEMAGLPAVVEECRAQYEAFLLMKRGE